MSAIPFTLCQEIMNDIAPAEIEDIDVTIKLANIDTITPLGIVRDVEVLCGKIKYATDFLVLGSPQDSFCPIIFGRPFLNNVNATIDCKREVVTTTKKYTSVMIRFCHSRSRFLSCMYIHDDSMTESR